MTDEDVRAAFQKAAQYQGSYVTHNGVPYSVVMESDENDAYFRNMIFVCVLFGPVIWRSRVWDEPPPASVLIQAIKDHLISGIHET